MKSFVDGFIDKRISVETLHRILDVNYQRNIFIEMVIDNYSKKDFEVIEGSQFFLKLKNDKYFIIVLLSKEKRTLDLIKKQIEFFKYAKIIYTVIFDQNDINENILNPVYINPKDWMNRIISNGINRQILHLQYLRDLEFNYK